ncbi:unnamed protein product [Prorocentrum cordatum]|uniref:Uncharacterized protein n=1 Tax=Prorocentrum cordatum TaxID=2364126 RepID=A0ABN9XD81_9DINO|nr:unnamed protein product [Polarella glacialis]
MDSPAAAMAGSVLAPALEPLASRVPPLDLAAVVAGRGRASSSQTESCQDPPPQKATEPLRPGSRAAPPLRGLAQEGLAIKRFRGRVLEGQAVRYRRPRAATESLLFAGLTVASPRLSSGGRAGGGQKGPTRGAATSTTMASAAEAMAREAEEGAAADGDRWAVDAASKREPVGPAAGA